MKGWMAGKKSRHQNQIVMLKLLYRLLSFSLVLLSIHQKLEASDHMILSLSSLGEERDSLNGQFQRLIKLSADALDSLGDDDIRSLDKSTIENFYWASTSEHLREEPSRVAALCRIAAIGDYPSALGHYANILFAGRGVTQHPREALTWYLKSAQAGDENTITFLNRLLKEGTLFTDFNVTEASEQAEITRGIEEAYRKLGRKWDRDE